MKRIVGFLLFTSLMLFKVSAFHVHTHHDDNCDAIENCEICDIALENQSAELEILAQPASPNYNNILLVKCFIEKKQAFSREPNIHKLFSRPPPSL